MDKQFIRANAQVTHIAFHSNIDNPIFKLHYRVTTALLLFCALLACTPYMGGPISCLQEDKNFDIDFLNSWCFIHSTYILPESSRSAKKYLVAHPGVAPLAKKTQIVKYVHYYQWVWFVLFFQAVLFYAPHYIWKTWQGGHMKNLLDSLTKSKKPEVTKKFLNLSDMAILIQYLKANLKYYDSFFLHFTSCEVLNFINVIFQAFLMDWLLGFEFATYGLRILGLSEQDPEDRQDVYAKIFPKMSKCTFNKYGPTGNIVNYDGLCVLQMNVVNEKIYAFLWFWFIILFIASLFQLIYRFLTMISPSFRKYLIQLKCRSNLLQPETIHFLSTCQMGDWFILSQIRNFMDPQCYTDFLNVLAMECKRDVNLNEIVCKT